MTKPQSTTVLAMVKNEKGKLVFAGDRLMSWNMAMSQSTPRAKVQKKNGFLLAGTGLVSIIDEVIHVFKMPQLPKTKGTSVRLFMQTTFIDHLMKHLRKVGIARPDRRALFGGNEHSADVDTLKAVIIIGIKGHLFELHLGSDDVAIIEVNVPFARGCGGLLAWGALLATEDLGMTAEERLTRAIKAAGTVSPGCNTEVDIVIED